ncbi:MAG TPA: hypothetical protein VEC11_14140 [Allosphingosinicella sp.]|nr:hypothetical protein [Allosphingosinicella sp.]
MSAITMGMVALTLNQGRAFWAASSARGKFRFQHVASELRVDPRTLDHVGYNLAFWFANTSEFPIEVEILDVRATIQDRTLDLGKPKDDIHIVEGQTQWFYNYGVIPYSAPADSEIKTPIFGTALIVVDYGRPGKSGYKDILSYNLIIFVDPYDGSVIRTEAYRIRSDD